ncbi:MAG TPA: toxin-antitoxin system HicB family antitoxin [Candidatus Obscuribacterales bacterium]
MATTKKSSGKAKAKTASKSAKPAKAAHKKVIGRKVVRKSAVKHAAKSKATRSPAAVRSDSDFSKFSGKFTVRLPKSLHQALVDRADKEGVSLNLFVTNALASSLSGKKR